MEEKIVYKNHCTPQEQVSSDGRYYLDGDVGRKLTGSAVLTGLTSSAPVTITANKDIGTGNDFISIILTSGDDISISLTGAGNEKIKLSEGECFSSKIHGSADMYIAISGTSTVEYFTGT
jgi:hypothetical protein